MIGAAVLALFVAACGDDDDDNAADTTGAPTTIAAATVPATVPNTTAPAATEPAATEPAATEPAATEAPATTAATPVNADTNGDGKVVIGVAIPGPRDDGAYYQSIADASEDIATERGWEDPIIVDNIQAADAATTMSDLAQQGVDLMIVGASEIAEPLPQLIEQYPDIFWYCNCGAGFPETPGLSQSTDDGGEISYTAGYATGLKLKETGGSSAYFIGCCDLGFEKQGYMAFELGLKAVDPSYTMTYVPTGDFPFDFDNTANATAALQTAIDNGADAVYPYLGGAHRPVVQAANEANPPLITMSAGLSSVCDPDEPLHYDIAVKFAPGDYAKKVMEEFDEGTFQRGSIRKFEVGVDPESGAAICNATPEQQSAMDEVYRQIKDGEHDEELGQIAATAFAEG
jgi:basic membrane protein A